LPIDESLETFNYISPSKVEYFFYLAVGILYSGSCLISKVTPFFPQFDLDLPPIPDVVDLPDIDLDFDIDLDLNFEAVAGSYNPFLNFEPVNACCKVEAPEFGDFEKRGIVPEFFRGCDGQGGPCAECDPSNACFHCKSPGEECDTGADCCQYSSYRKKIYYCDKTDPSSTTGVCQIQPSSEIGTPFDSFCFAYNDGVSVDSAALGFKDGIPPISILPGFNFPGRLSRQACYLHYGLAPKEQKGKFAFSMPILGFGLSTEDRLSYGANYWTQVQGTNDNLNEQVPPVWDGFVDVELPERAGFDFWFAARLKVQPGPIWNINKLKCEAIPAEEIPETDATDISLNIDFELYADIANTDSPCILLTMPSAFIKLSFFEFRIGRGIGGFCKSLDPCSPSGFFVNMEPRLEAKVFFYK